MMASLVTNEQVGAKASQKVSQAVVKLIMSASSSSLNENSENQIFFIAPKNAYDPQTFNLVQVNYHMMNALV